MKVVFCVVAVFMLLVASVAFVPMLFLITLSSQAIISDEAAAALTPESSIPQGEQILPIDSSYYKNHPDWFTKSHHDYPAADLPVSEGTTVYASVGGRVIYTSAGNNCGNGIMIKTADDYLFTYCHGSQLLVANQSHIVTGTPIMRSGNTGVSSGPHLHFQIANPSGQKLCPQPALAAWGEGKTFDLGTLPTSGCTY